MRTKKNTSFKKHKNKSKSYKKIEIIKTRIYDGGMHANEDHLEKGETDSKSTTDFNQQMINLAKQKALNSPDPTTKVGCVIYTKNRETIHGCNDFPSGIKNLPERLERPAKYNWIEHAERNAIYNAVKNGISLDKSTMFLNWYPCIDCARAIIQSGISVLVCENEPNYNHERWGEQFKIVTQLLEEASITVIYQI